MFYQFAWYLCRAVLRYVRRWEVDGAANLPAAGGIVVTANHTSYWDPVVIGCAIYRRVYFMAKAELFRYPVLKQIIIALGTFPVRRDTVDREAIRAALDHLSSGRVLGIFPEGTRSKGGEFLKPQYGAALLALKGGVPILPVALSGTKGVFGKVRVRIGTPMQFPDYAGVRPTKEVLEEVSNLIMKEISTLQRSER
ncbi:MAG: 1-acyl-sn-glycerol-3-phosphate acyltransferase [Candidatus Desulforudis sp.]|nr:1-acyl-sn-glycerol-3-phosphate acyltransferase [Desulforudis sp.]